MLGKLPDWRYRQKLKQRVCEDADPETALECFQISVNIIEAKNLACVSSQSGDSYVVVTLGKERYKTILKKKIDTSSKEYLIFEWRTCLREIQRSHLWMALMEPRSCASPRLLGEASVDLGVIWAQPNHQVFHKWAQLTLPRSPSAGIVGFLKVDISIICRPAMQTEPQVISRGKLEERVLQSVAENQTANYVITIYNAFIVPVKRHEARQEKLPSTYVKVSFCGVSVKTATQTRTYSPRYCEQVSITEMFPTICQTVRLEVCSIEAILNNAVASVDLNLGQISHHGDNGFVPTFGPSLLHMYGNAVSGMETPGGEGPFYRGAMLVSMRTIVPYSEHAIQITNVEPVPPISMESLWTWEDICIYCPVLEVSMLDRQLAGKRCGVAFTVGEIPYEYSSNEDFMNVMKEIKKKKLHYTGPIPLPKNANPYGFLDFANAFPVLQYATRLPGFRFRIYRNNFVQKIAETFEKSLQEVENRLNNNLYSYPSEILQELVNAFDVAAEQIQNFLEIADGLDVSPKRKNGQNHYTTTLDRKQLALQKEELEKIYHQMKEKLNTSSEVNLMKMINKTSPGCYSISKKNVKRLLVESIEFIEKLKSLVFKSAEGWPDIVMWLLNDGSRFAFYKFSMADVFFSEVPELCGKNCGRIQTVYLKPLKCPKHVNVASSCCTCITGKIELIIWTGLFSSGNSFDSCLPKGLRVKTREYDICLKAPVMMIKCRVFIYRAKITVNEGVTPPNAFVRINVLNASRDSQVQAKTSSPVWDQVLTVTSMVRTSQGRMTASPPEVMVEVFHHESPIKLELIGRTIIRPQVAEVITADYAPQMKWQDLLLGSDCTGHILSSALIQQMPETLVKSTIYNSINEVEETNDTQEVYNDAEDNKIEQLPRSVKPRYSSYKVDVYWWGLRDMTMTRKPCAVLEIDDLIIKSDIITEKKTNRNFPNGRTSQTFVGNFENAYCSPLTVKIYDSSTFGRVIFFGTNAVKNPTKYLVDWMPKHDRESSLKAASFASSDFVKVTKTLFVKRPAAIDSTESSEMTINSNSEEKKWATWRMFFCRKEPHEQEYILLPMHVTGQNHNEVDVKSEVEYQDWWSRFFASQKERDGDKCSGFRKIKIYDDELERQPEFEKFKDWCSALKLYNGTKTGIPEKDEELRCGIVKVGIAIYRWPPPPNTVAVSWGGVHLDRGYFDDFPHNEDSKFLVRVYVVRGINFTPIGSCNPYVLVNCGTKQCGSRDDFQENAVNPIFGRTYEMQCTLPDDYMMTVSIHNYDTSADDTLIGCTDIDLEDRIYSRHRGRIGLASEYNVMGSAKWRDSEKPSEILTKLCVRNHLHPPTFPDGNTVTINNVEYRDGDKTNKTYISASERRENLCLNLLNRWHTLPLCGYHLVPEHVETRSLINPTKPDVEQGKILMWVDIFPLEVGPFMPLPVDITSRKVEDYELRVIVWHVQSLQRESFASRKKLDMYVKAIIICKYYSWIGNVEQAHYTDIHYNSTNGEANFNWRMIFDFKYQHADKKLVLTEKGPFTEYEEHLPPVLVVQVADSDAETVDAHLASLTLDLTAIPRGSKHMQRCSLNNMENTKKVNLFLVRSLRAWWPLKTIDENSWTEKFIGKIDLELHLLPKSKAIIMPVGIGRDPPFPLPMPNRPEPSRLKSTIFETIFHRGGAEYLVIGFLLTLLFIVLYWDLPLSVGSLSYYY